MIIQAQLKELLSYDPVTGMFTWKVARGGMRVGQLAGCKDTWGHIQIKINGTLYLAHRLAWMYMNGSFPNKGMDHINVIKYDNRWSNLRPATAHENMANRSKTSLNTSGYKGVCWHKNSSKFRARCTVNGHRHSLGYFVTAEEASLAYQDFAKRHHKEFYRSGDIV